MLTIRTALVKPQQPELGRCLEAATGGYVVLSVSDTGVGMDEENRGRIFEP